MAGSSEFLSCKVCGLTHEVEALEPGQAAHCRRCGALLERHTPKSLALTAAFALSALFLYAPANLFPILRMNLHGAVTENTVLQGCIRFYEDGDYMVAIVVFLASFLIPVLKILGLLALSASARFGFGRWKLARTRLYRLIDGVGKWAMLDVFVLAILVSLVKLQRLAAVVPGRGLLAFASVVVLTLLASASFDPQLLWQEESRA